VATWIVGDIHGCAEELARLIERLTLAPGDRLVSVGDLFHRGPDPVGVMELLRQRGAQFVLGNHELAVLRRVGLAPASVLADGRPALRERFPELDEQDLAGDGDTPCRVAPERRAEMLVFLQQHSGFVLRERGVPGAESTRDGRSWCVIHAGVNPLLAPERNSIRELTTLRRLSGRGHPWWYEDYAGPDLILFGHTPSQTPRVHTRRGRALALGLDTGCVYGGKLSAYCPEFDELRSVSAQRAYAAV
jgi:hypothetical protein